MKPDSYAVLEPMLSARLKKGVRTNAFLSKDELEMELALGRLTVDENNDGLLLFRERESRRIMNFYLSGPQPPSPKGGVPTVTEIAFRAGDRAMAQAAELWKGLGFREVLRRVRLRRQRGAATGTGTAVCGGISPVKAAEAEAAMKLLTSSFDPLTGCVPTMEELTAAIDKGRLLAARDGGGLGGLLHFSSGKGATQILHLTVRKDLRGHGLAGKLIRALLPMAENRLTVWTAEDNAAALKAYEKEGFAPDEWNSIVLIKN